MKTNPHAVKEFLKGIELKVIAEAAHAIDANVSFCNENIRVPSGHDMFTPGLNVRKIEGVHYLASTIEIQTILSLVYNFLLNPEQLASALDIMEPIAPIRSLSIWEERYGNRIKESSEYKKLSYKKAQAWASHAFKKLLEAQSNKDTHRMFAWGSIYALVEKKTARLLRLCQQCSADFEWKEEVGSEEYQIEYSPGFSIHYLHNSTEKLLGGLMAVEWEHVGYDEILHGIMLLAPLREFKMRTAGKRSSFYASREKSFNEITGVILENACIPEDKKQCLKALFIQ